jgi:hypothetical protein
VAATDSDLNVVSYARISADGERDEHGVKDQHRTNRETAKRYGWRVVAEFTDNDKSAAKKKVTRDDFEAMLKVLHSGRLSDGTPVHGVVVRADDRLARRPSDYERFVDAITIEDGRVYADQQGSKDLYRDSTESMGLIGAVISKMEVRKMQRRTPGVATCTARSTGRTSHMRESRPHGPSAVAPQSVTGSRRQAELDRRFGEEFHYRVKGAPLRGPPAADRPRAGHAASPGRSRPEPVDRPTQRNSVEIENFTA